MTNVDEHGRTFVSETADEATMLRGFLDIQRATLAWKCGGLDAAGLRATLAPSPMTLGGMLKHLAYVEDMWLSHWLTGEDRQPPFDTVDWSADRDWDWHSAAEDTPEQLFALWQATVARSDALVAAAIAERGLDGLAKCVNEDGSSTNVRWLLCHMIEEYARHVGHADLIRESVDGLVGE